MNPPYRQPLISVSGCHVTDVAEALLLTVAAVAPPATEWAGAAGRALK